MLTLVTGGSKSGKSEYAETLAVNAGDVPRYYIATMIPWDAECELRIARHRAMRSKKRFKTVECHKGLEDLKLLEGRKTVLLECMSNLVSNELYLCRDCTPDKILLGLEHLYGQADNLIIVTNDVFSDGNDYSLETNSYRKILGEINREIARRADQVTEVVAGIPIKVK